MRLIATIPGLLYVADAAGQLHVLPARGGSGHVVPYADIEARSLRRHAGWLERQGKQQQADEYDLAADALEALTAVPVAVAA